MDDNMDVELDEQVNREEIDGGNDYGEEIDEEKITTSNEILEILERCNELHNHFHKSSKTIQDLHSLVDSHQNIIVKTNDWTGDFDELLEKLHIGALEDIKKRGVNNFGEKLLEVIEQITVQ
jgi:hypothetical protein